MDEAQMDITAVDLIAVSDSPGLAGALLVGVSFALGLHTGFGIDITGVNHLEGHIASITLQYPDLTAPFLALVVSGGHTAVYRVDDFGTYHGLGQTVDDAAGEAFDKIGKLIGFPYPAGRQIEQEARRYQGDEHIAFPIARMKSPLDFSFSGLKTAVKYFAAQKGQEWIEGNKPQLCSSFQKAIIDALVRNALKAADQTGIRTLAVVGGVACNGMLRERMAEAFGESVCFPDPVLCTDNAAMIAKAGYENFRRGRCRPPAVAPSRAL
jgi:N6-L-threonylcarbamoyladenine synthase